MLTLAGTVGDWYEIMEHGAENRVQGGICPEYEVLFLDNIYEAVKMYKEKDM